MDIKPIDLTVKSMLESYTYKIPRFQRPYSWDRENVADFWNDVTTSEEPGYFIGSFVVYRHGSVDPCVFVVDGQQRITTITLLLAGLRDALEADGHNALARGVQTLVERPDINNELQYVLQSETPYPYLQEHIQKFGTAELPASTGAEEDALKGAFEYLKDQLKATLAAIDSDPTIAADKKKDRRKAKLLQLRDRLLSLQLIFIQLVSEDDAYLIFETLNTRGKDLRVSDLVKNHLTRTLRAKNSGVDVAKEKWEKVRSHLDESEEDIDINRFLHHSWLSEHPYLPEKQLFKEIKRTVLKASAMSYLDGLCSDALLYRRIVDPGSHKWKRAETPIAESLKALGLFRVVQPVPMLLSILRSYGLDRLSLKQTVSLLRSLENFHFQFSAITAQRTGGGTGLMFALAARELHQATSKNLSARVVTAFLQKLRDRLPTKAEFAAAFAELRFTDESAKQRLLVRHVLVRLDQFEHRYGSVNYDDMSIEHVSPQRPRPGEPDTPPNIGKLGNLLLVPTKLNNELLANKTFAAKKAILKKHKVPLPEHMRTATQWGESEIDTRTSELAVALQDKVFRV